MANQLYLTADGSHSLLSENFNVSYHSKHGAIQESQHVFINAGLLHRSKTKQVLNVLEIGFGTGLNALMTLQIAEQHQLKINYQTYEAYPISDTHVSELNYATQLDIDPSILDHLHHCDWNTPHIIQPYFQFTKWLKRFEEITDKDQFDVIYFDAFAPNAQTELWEKPLLQKMYDALKPEGVLTTYCAKGVVKRCFKTIGFELESIPGPPGKREMTRVIKN